MALYVNRIVGQDKLLARPRISAKVSEYIVEYFNEKLLVPSNIMQSVIFDYSITLSFDQYLPGQHKINSVGPYATDTTKFVTPKGFSIVDKTNKTAFLAVISSQMDEKINPKDYALLVYDLFASFLIKNFKKIKKQKIDELQNGLDFSLIESFKFPAPFEEQKYILDDNKYIKGWEQDYASPEEVIWIIPNVDYKRHYGF